MVDQSERYTFDEALEGLRAIVCELAGKEIVVEPGRRVDHVLADMTGKPLDDATAEFFMDDMLSTFHFSLMWHIEQLFGTKVTMEEWSKLLGGDAKSPTEWLERVAPQWTIAKLAAVIVLRSRKVSFEPVSILGRRCEPAGVFRGMEDVAYTQNPKLAKFGPSTPIRDRLRGSKLAEFWNRVRFCSGRQIPAVVDPTSSKHWAWKYSNWVTLLLLPVVVIETMLWVGLIPRGFVHAWVPPVVGVVIGLALAIHARIRIGRIFAWFVNPLPEDIHTFRDLAELIVRHREQDMVAA